MNVQAMTRTSGLMLFGLAAGFAAASCVQETSFVNLNHCANQNGNAWCSERYGGDDQPRPYCILGNGLCGATPGQDGCVADEPVDGECYSPCGDSQSASENSACLGVMESTDGTMSTGETTDDPTGSESSTTGPAPCAGNEDCPDAAAPFCEPVSGECVACDGTDDPDGACAGLDPGLPLCVGGACVACTAENPAACTGETPICDDATNSCVPCTEHGQCGEAACNLFSGACLPADAVVHVGGAMPDFATIEAAVMSFDAMTEGTIIMHAGAYNDQAVTVDGGRVLAFLAAEDAAMPPRWTQSSGGPPQLTVTDATVLMDGLQVSGNADDLGLRVDAGRAWVDRSRVINNTGGGVLAENAAELVLRNSFVGGDDDTAAVNVDAATARISFSTLGGGTITATGLSCTAPDSVEVRSSIIVALGIMATGGVDVACSVADITYTATETPFVGTGNVTVGELPLMTPEDWFVSYGLGDYHLQNDGLDLFADVAQWQDGDPRADIDGDPRPAVDGTPDFAGADLVP
jgi:hypothetical protein